ncbi:PQQ-dependent sugar dehydrogenase [Marilutibacter alkalisoli]|uniref:PQQ-dependent sugar dehydrogenase n=1 Tax=Marilutibacter alkalisoli TaxID=2591633 RepID=A0A514BUZ7_9GAMM|nr:PQQ-dependent sugar dehydrogenase [Lysobacter alkalisoli]QDH71135.1 PQQ-dependent sugar dehydrogenase [Lysobacter alkalisoli]
MPRNLLSIACLSALLLACGNRGNDVAANTSTAAAQEPAAPFVTVDMASFDEPWAMAFLPDGRLLVTEKRGKLKLVTLTGEDTGNAVEISGVPEVAYGGQGGFGDVILHPDFANNNLVYISYAEPGEGDTRGAAVARARLQLNARGGGRLSGLEVIWRQVPKVTGQGHYGHRMAFDRDGYLWVSSGERQKFDPAQDMNSNMGKILRLNDDGTAPADNPFVDQGEVAAQVWSLGHRNVLGIAFDAEGRLWNNEMGPKGGDELNLVERGGNYGYPIVSNGDHYDGRPIPNHDTRPEFIAPKITWTPVISPSGFVIYDGDRFPHWKGNGFITGLSSQSLVRIEFDGEEAREAERFDMGKRMRAIRQGPEGSLWLLEDGANGRLLELSPPPTTTVEG